MKTESSAKHDKQANNVRYHGVVQRQPYCRVAETEQCPEPKRNDGHMDVDVERSDSNCHDNKSSSNTPVMISMRWSCRVIVKCFVSHSNDSQRRRNGFKTAGAHPAGNFFKKCPPLLLVPPTCGVGTVGHEGVTASSEFSYFTAFILSP